MSHLLHILYQHGLIQFGRFSEGEDNFTSIRTNLSLLPSYSIVLNKVVLDLYEYICELNTEYVLATHDAIPLGTHVAKLLDVPLLYQSTSDKTPANHIVGAYDVGHPTVIVANVAKHADLQGLLDDASRVGLEVIYSIAILSLNDKASGIQTEALFHSNDIDNLRRDVI